MLRVLADLASAESLFQREGTATGKERDENAVVAGTATQLSTIISVPA